MTRWLQDWLAYPRQLPTMRDVRAAFLGACGLVGFVNGQSFVLKWHEQATRPPVQVLKRIPKMCVFPPTGGKINKYQA